MAVHDNHHADGDRPLDPARLGGRAAAVIRGSAVTGAAGLALAIGLGLASSDGFRRFWFAYLVAFCFALTIALGSLVFVLLQHLARAGWSVTVRRTAESVAAGALPALAALVVLILVSVAMQNGELYRWALPLGAAVAAGEAPGEHAKAVPAAHPAADGAATAEPEGDPAKAAHPAIDELTLKKRAWLNPTFFVLRVLGYFAVWTLIARWYWRQSTRQDESEAPEATSRMQARAPLSVIAVGVTITLGAFDLVMSLDPHWYSTIFGVYFFAGSAVASFATLVVVLNLLRRAGHLRGCVGHEHFHDLGKYLFGFVFFWGYIAFSQFMLLWYANVPEETQWFVRRGATTVPADVAGWSGVIVAILFGHLLLPFAGLLSRHVKRRNGPLLFWAVWLLGFHYLDLYWVIVPEMGKSLSFGLIDLAALAGVGGACVAAVVYRMAGQSLMPTGDPRLPEALAFQNI